MILSGITVNDAGTDSDTQSSVSSMDLKQLLCRAVGFELDDDNNIEFDMDFEQPDSVAFDDVPQAQKTAYCRLQGEFDYLLPQSATGSD